MNGKDFWTAIKELSNKLFAIYAAVSELADNDVGYCFSSNQGIAVKMDKHKDNVSRGISELVKKGFLYSLEIKKGFVVLERRLYTSSGYKTYLEDKDNLENLIVTKYEQFEKTLVYYNERNPKITIDEINIGTNDENDNGELSIDEIDNGTHDEIINGTNDEIDKYNSTNNNLTNTNRKSESESDIEFDREEIVKGLLEKNNLKLDDNFIKDLSEYYLDQIKACVEKIPEDVKNPGGYLRQVIKNQGLRKRPKNKLKTRPILESKSKNLSKEQFLKEFLNGREIEDLLPSEKSILDKTLPKFGGAS